MYPTTKELVDGSTVDALTSLTSEQQDALRQTAINEVERHCRQSFLPEGTEEDPVTKIIDGTGSDRIYLPARLAILTGLSVPSGAFGAADVVLSEKRDRLHLRPEPAASTWATRVIAEATGADRFVFPSGPGTIEVTGVWGWPGADYPAAVTTALRFDMEDRALAGAHKLADTVQSARALGVASVRQGNLSIDLGGRQPTVTLRVRRALSRLRWSTGGSGALA